MRLTVLPLHLLLAYRIFGPVPDQVIGIHTRVNIQKSSGSDTIYCCLSDASGFGYLPG